MANKNFKNIINIISEIELTIKGIQGIEYMLRGSYGKAYRRCGKSNCRCADPKEKAHPFYRITWTENGKSYTRNIPEKDRVWVEQAVKNYRSFKKNWKKLNSLYDKINDQLNQIEKKLVKRTRKQKSYF